MNIQELNTLVDHVAKGDLVVRVDPHPSVYPLLFVDEVKFNTIVCEEREFNAMSEEFASYRLVQPMKVQ